ncbi:MAG: hypothetical protein ACI9CF_000402 [Candidatus Omnitrophota bacterium]|jgi:hypothetical protein
MNCANVNKTKFVALTILAVILIIGYSSIAKAANVDEENFDTRLLFRESFDKDIIEAEEKAQKRLKFNEYFEKWLVKADEKKDQKRVERLKTRVRSTLFHKTGYDSNIFFNTARKGDLYQEESGSTTLYKNHDSFLGIFGKGTWLTNLGTKYRAYSTHDLFDYHRSNIQGKFKTTIYGNVSIDAAYELVVNRYIRFHNLTYKSHNLEYGLNWDNGGKIRYRAYTKERFKYYTDRRSSTPFDADSEKTRKDIYHEAGIKATVYPNKSLIYSGTVAWLRNDSSDQFQDFNDYESVRLSGFALWKINKDWKWVGYGGWTYKEYDDRRISFTSNNPERDTSFYLGNELTLGLSNNWDFVCSYTHNQNGSNVKTQHYSSYSATTGFRWRN